VLIEPVLGRIVKKFTASYAARSAATGPVVGNPSPGAVIHVHEILIIEMDPRKILLIQG
jgi:hypothetical protein